MSTNILTDEQCLEAALDADPADWDARRALADLLLERGDEAGSECLQWQVAKKVCPDPSGGEMGNQDSTWAWLRSKYKRSGNREIVPMPIERRFDTDRPDVPIGELCCPPWNNYTRAAADAALRAAWARLTPAEREACWKWEGK